MAARAALSSLLGTDSQMNMLGFEEEVMFSSNATDSPNRERKFAVMHWDDVPSSNGLAVYMVSVWYHSPVELGRDYGDIDLALLRTKELMKTVEHLEGADGWVLCAATWISSSPDLFDDGYNSLTRYVQFRCSCRNVA